MTGQTSLVATPSQTIGPFFHFALAAGRLGNMADRFSVGERVRLVIRVTDGDSQPVADGLVELVQAGIFGRLPTQPDGTCEFATMRPGTTGGPPDSDQAPHIDLCLFARGLLRQLHTRIYFAGPDALESDPTLALVPPARRATLLATPTGPHDTGRWAFDLRLQGPTETVFFDV